MSREFSQQEIRETLERCAGDFGRFAFEGFGVILSDEQMAAHEELGGPTPRRTLQDPKYYWLSGGQRGGKTVFGFLEHADACLYKRGLDTTDRRFWRNYEYKTLHLGPSDELAGRMWTIADTMQKGVNESQYDKRRGMARDGAFLSLFTVGKSGPWGIVRWKNGSLIDFRSSEGRATRLEGGQWWFITWDEWASQPDHEIRTVLSDVLLGRGRDHDAKIMPMAWPKPETERHLISVIRAIEKGTDHESRVIYLSAEAAHFTNQKALAVEKRVKTKAEYLRTVLGRPAGGAAIEFRPYMTDRLFRPNLPLQAHREDGFAYLSAWDLGAAHDSTVGTTWRIPIVDGRRIVSVAHKARLVHAIELPGSDVLSLDTVAFEIIREQQAYASLTGVDASGLGGIQAFRAIKDIKPTPLAFVSKSNDRLHGNIRLAAITNAIDLLTWGRVAERSLLEGEDSYDWGMIEAPMIQALVDQLANFDRDAKNVPDDWVWSMLIGLWYMRRFWVVTGAVHEQRPFNPLSGGRFATTKRIVGPSANIATATQGGVRLIEPRR